MPVFRPDEFFVSKEKNEVVRKLKSEGKRAQIIAGGTGFYELAKRGYIPEVKKVVSIMQLGLGYVSEDPNQVKIGATTTLQTLLESGIGGKEGLEAVGDALYEIRPIQVRNVATIGGEVCISVPVVDLPTALLACGATLKIIKDDQEYETRLEDFYIDAFLTKLKYGEVVKEVALPKQGGGKLRSAFVKFGRTAYDFNLINCATLLSSDTTNKKIDSLCVYLGGIKRTPIRASDFERKLLGKVPDERTIFEAAQSSFSKSNFLPSVHGSNEYKHAVLPVVLRDCIMKAYKRTLSS